MPALEIVRLPNDHTGGARADAPTPRAYMADNDLALGRMIESFRKRNSGRAQRCSWSKTMRRTGPTTSIHIDRSCTSYRRTRRWSRSQVRQHDRCRRDDGRDPEAGDDVAVRSLRTSAARDLEIESRSEALCCAQAGCHGSTKRIRKSGIGAQQSRGLALGKEDEADEDLFNRILWRQIKGARASIPVRRGCRRWS